MRNRATSNVVRGAGTLPRRSLNIAVRIQHHPSRANLIPALLEQLAGLEDVRVMTDEAEGKPDTWRAHRACLEAMPDTASHLLAVQDDALPCESFADKAQAAIEAKPDVVVCLFAPGFGFIRRRMLQAQRERRAYALMPQTAFVPLVAIIYPRAVVERLLGWSGGGVWPAASARTLRGSDDGIVAQFCRTTRTPVWMTVPSLVDHRTDVPSVIRPSHQAGPHRRAALLMDSDRPLR